MFFTQSRKTRSADRPGRPVAWPHHIETLDRRCLLAAGTLDPTFGNGGLVTTDIGGPTYNDARDVVVAQPDGKIVTVGSSSALDGTKLVVLRYHENGEPDLSFDGDGQAVFGPDTGLHIVPESVAIDSSGRIVVAGYFDAGIAGTGYDFAVIRLKADGSPDPSFGSNGKAAVSFGTGSTLDFARALAVDAANRMVVVGSTSSSGSSDFAIARFNVDGTLDLTFDGDGKATFSFGPGNTFDAAAAVAIDSASRLVVAGTSDANGSITGSDFAVIRLNNDGTLDSTFDGDGKALVSFGTGQTSDSGIAVAMDAAGRIVLGGTTSANYASSLLDFAVARLHSNGTLDALFDGDGRAVVHFAYDNAVGVAVDSADRIMIGGYAHDSATGTGSDFALARLQSSGALDSSFDGDGKSVVSFGTGYTEDVAAGVAMDPSGRIILAGATGPWFGNRDVALVRVASDGTLDGTFGGDGRVTTDVLGPSNDRGADLVVMQPDGKIVVAGTNGAGIAVLRYNDDGSLDSSFGAGGKAVFPGLGDATALTLNAAGRIVVSSYSFVLRLNTNGSLDSSFDGDGVAFVPSQTSYDVIVDSSDRIVLAGTKYGGSTGFDFAVTRLNHDGTLDTTFDGDGQVTLHLGAGSATDIAYALAADSTGRIVLAGYTASSSSDLDFAIARLHADGTLDNGFDGDGKKTIDFGDSVDYALDVAIDSAGRIVLAGSTSYRASWQDFAVLRLDSQGAMDTSFGSAGKTVIGFFSPFSGIDAATSVAIDANGYIAVAGLTNDFTRSHIALALLKPDGCLDMSFGTSGQVVTDFGTFPSSAEAYGVAFDSQGRIVVAGTASIRPSLSVPSRTGTDIALVRYVGHDPVIDAGSPTVAGDLQAAVAMLDAAVGVVLPQVVLQVHEPSEMPAALAAIANLTVDPAGPAIDILLDTDAGTYEFGSVVVPAGLRLILDGGGCPHTFASSSGPVLTLVGGDLLVRNGAIFRTTVDAPTIRVQAGRLTMRDSQVDETIAGDQPAIHITGGLVDLGGTTSNQGNNFITIHGAGLFLQNTGPNDVPAGGNLFFIDDRELFDSFRIEDHVEHAMDGLGGGVVYWRNDAVFVSEKGGSIQRGVNVVKSGGMVAVESGGHYESFLVGSKFLTISFGGWANTEGAMGLSMTQKADLMNPAERTVFVWGSYDRDIIVFSPGLNPGDVQVRINNLPKGTFAPTGRLVAYGDSSNDDLQVADGLLLPAWLYGGDGADRLKGGMGNDALMGGTGDDLLVGGDGRDLLIGGQGADRIVGNADDDILIAGYTRHDFESHGLRKLAQHEFAIDAILDVWSSNDSWDSRTSQLLANYLRTDGPAQTVLDDGDYDVMTGSDGRDWFFANLDSGVKDKITDLSAAEFANDLDFINS